MHSGDFMKEIFSLWLFTQPFIQARLKENIIKPVTRKIFPFDDVIMDGLIMLYEFCNDMLAIHPRSYLQPAHDSLAKLCTLPCHCPPMKGCPHLTESHVK